ncbi:MAG: hypothetical protein ACOVLE_12315 [Pirellula staleyi]
MVISVEYEGGIEERILGGDARLIKAGRQPCLICGHPTGDCTGDSGPPIRVLGPDIFPSLQQEEVFIIQEDIYEERAISNLTKTQILVAAKGTAVPISKARDLGLC